MEHQDNVASGNVDLNFFKFNLLTDFYFIIQLNIVTTEM